MKTGFNNSLAIIVRATGEATMPVLISQLRKQIAKTDCLIVLDKEECFEDKLRRGFEVGLQKNKAFTVFIDADILLRKQTLKQIKKNISKLNATDLGFGLRLWDRFYDRPKFRGLHVYRTSLLEKAIACVPEANKHLRPESHTKKELSKKGYTWRNDISFYVAGLHDFYQNADDIYYKFIVRSKRSQNDLIDLKTKFRSTNEVDFKIALRGLEDGEQMEKISNNKYIYKSNTHNLPKFKRTPFTRDMSVDFIIIKKIFKYYHFSRLFWKSI